MDSRQQALRTIALKLNVSGTAEVLDETKLYKDSYGFVKLQAYAPKTQNTQAPACTAFCTTQNEFGVEKISSNNYNLLYVDEFALDGQAYLLFECYLPKEFTSIATPQNGLKITINYYDTAPTLDTLGNPVLDANGVPTRHTTALLVSSRYTTTVYPGGWNNADIELSINSAEAAQINDNMRNIAELQLDFVGLENRANESDKTANDIDFRMREAEKQIKELQNTGVDKTARKQIKDEILRAQDEENTLRNTITGETLRAEQAESAIVEDLTSHISERVEVEKSRAENIEQDLQNNICAETLRAENAESDLQSQISAETSRAMDAENVLASDIQGLREDITNESHFRGMFDSVEALKAANPTSTPNDYAYIVSGNIWIWQDNEWTDSEKPTPNTAIPLSDSTPLMDGVASAGTSNEGARSDHRHASDTNKVNKSGDTMTGDLSVIKSSGETMLRTKRTDTDNAVAFGIGMGGINRGVWDEVNNKWVVHTDGEKVYVDGYVAANDAKVVHTSGGTITGDLKVTDTVTATTFRSSGEYLRVITKDDNDNSKVFGIKGSNANVYNLQTMKNDISEAYSPNNPPPVTAATAAVAGAVYGITQASTYYNTMLGYSVRTNTQGAPASFYYNVIVGYNAVVSTVSGGGAISNNIVIGYNASVISASNTVQIGNSNISTANIKVSWTVTSDERDKADIAEIDSGKALEFICAVEPIQYVDNDREKYLLREKKTVTHDDGIVTEEYDENGENERVYQQYGMCEYDREAHSRGDKKGERKRIGVKAQQVQSLLQDIFGSDNYANLVNDNFYDLRANESEPPVENHLSVAYERFVPFLIAAIKQQQKQIVALEKRINSLECK